MNQQIKILNKEIKITYFKKKQRNSQVENNWNEELARGNKFVRVSQQQICDNEGRIKELEDRTIEIIQSEKQIWKIEETRTGLQRPVRQYQIYQYIYNGNPRRRRKRERGSKNVWGNKDWKCLKFDEKTLRCSQETQWTLNKYIDTYYSQTERQNQRGKFCKQQKENNSYTLMSHFSSKTMDDSVN